MVQRYSTPVGRSRHGKRLPQVPDNSGGLSNPAVQPAVLPIVTPTVTITVTPSPTVRPTTATVADTNVSPVVVTPTETPSNDGGYYASTTYGPGDATSNDGTSTGKTNAAQVSISPSSSASSTASNSSSHETPVGAIVGVVLGVVLLLAAGAIFWFRRRAVMKRLKTRQWAKNQNDSPSFLWVEPKQKELAQQITPFPVMSSRTLQPYRGGDPEAGLNMMFGGPGGAPPVSYGLSSNNGLPYIPPPAPPQPPKAAGMYDLPSPAPAPTTPASALSANDAAHALPKAPVSASNPTSPSPNTKQPESAKVRSTFIPTLPDELTITAGEMVRIHQEYDDGWALCSNARGEMGMAPLECLDKASELPKPSNREFRKSIRVSSLAATPKSAYSVNQSMQ